MPIIVSVLPCTSLYPASILEELLQEYPRKPPYLSWTIFPLSSRLNVVIVGCIWQSPPRIFHFFAWYTSSGPILSNSPWGITVALAWSPQHPMKSLWLITQGKETFGPLFWSKPQQLQWTTWICKNCLHKPTCRHGPERGSEQAAIGPGRPPALTTPITFISL